MQDHHADVIHRVAALAASLGMGVVVQPGMLGRATVHATTEDAEAIRARSNVQVEGAEGGLPPKASPRTQGSASPSYED